MKTTDLDYILPETLIARRPPSCRHDSRLMLVGKGADSFSHHGFRDLPGLLLEGDLVVFNDTRVFPARLLGRRAPEGGKVEVLLTERGAEVDEWWGLVRPGKRIKEGDRIVFADGDVEATVVGYGKQGGGERLLRFRWSGDWWPTLDRVGHTPLPPYILRARQHDAATEGGEAGESPVWACPEESEDRERYQTVYASEERGSVAAPTAGLHFTQEVLDDLERRGVQRSSIRLHVGAGTFQPIKTERIEDHEMHEESFYVPNDALRQIRLARKEGRRVVAVGTTVARALETAVRVESGEAADIYRPDGSRDDSDDGIRGRTRLLIAPGFAFRAIDGLLTNFHLPRSTLLLLVSALAGTETIRKAYGEAVLCEYRFYSYGDCMLIV